MLNVKPTSGYGSLDSANAPPLSPNVMRPIPKYTSSTKKRAMRSTGGRSFEDGVNSPINMPVGMKPPVSPPAIAKSAKITDSNGNLSLEQKGLDLNPLRRLTFYHSILELSWTQLIFWSLLLYLLVVACFTATYYGMCLACGARVTGIIALYFNAVTLSSNGGYMGEDPHVTDPTSTCYQFRTYIVLLASYVNIVFAGLTAAVMVSKASTHTKLRYNVVFSDFCAYDDESDTVSFQLANMGQRALVNGRLRVFLVRVIPRHTTDSRGNHNAKVHMDELRWKCATESTTTGGDDHDDNDDNNGSDSSSSSELLLWYPCRIDIDSAKLFRNAKVSECEMNGGTACLTAVYEASDAHTGGTVEARFTYQFSQVIRGYAFSDDVMSIKPDGLISVDFRKINELIPLCPSEN